MDLTPQIPNHLKGILADATIGSSVCGHIQCPCGNRQLELFCIGEVLIEQKLRYLTPIKFDSHFHYQWIFDCPECSRQEVIFDSNRHGYDGQINQSSLGLNPPRPERWLWQCEGCNQSKYLVSVRAQLDEDACENAEELFSAENWFDGYECFSLRTKCVNCGSEAEPGFMETA